MPQITIFIDLNSSQLHATLHNNTVSKQCWCNNR